LVEELLFFSFLFIRDKPLTPLIGAFLWNCKKVVTSIEKKQYEKKDCILSERIRLCVPLLITTSSLWEEYFALQKNDEDLL
jgi:hypothetical protein